jgi:hypothetical protein
MNELDVHLLVLILWTDMMRLGELVQALSGTSKGSQVWLVLFLGLKFHWYFVNSEMY